ncbi:hypothetical protein FACS1894186_1050 [Alphaproteobacteria bacterium]|nr:hypothetical protein FACS1894186_1050 [Alphaproteobacteria bacterium]
MGHSPSAEEAKHTAACGADNRPQMLAARPEGMAPAPMRPSAGEEASEKLWNLGRAMAGAR